MFDDRSLKRRTCQPSHVVCYGDCSDVALSTKSIRTNSRTSHCECLAEPHIIPLLFCGFVLSSKTLKPQTNSSVFGSLQNLKEDKTKPVIDEYEYVSDEGELKIDEFPIRRKKNTVKRDLSCEYFGLIWLVFQFI